MLPPCQNSDKAIDSLAPARVDATKAALSDFLNEASKNPKVSFIEENFSPPLYNIWAFAKKTNEVSHFGGDAARFMGTWGKTVQKSNSRNS